MSRVLTRCLSQVELGEPQQFKNMVVLPIFTQSNSAPDYLTLSEALAQGSATITEISAGGAVPQVKVVNGSESFLLLVEGEELIGKTGP